MLVECVQGSVSDLVGFTSGFVQDLAVAGNTVDRFEVMLVPEVQLGPGRDDGLVEGKAHAVFLEQHAAACPPWSGDFPLGTDNVLHSYDFHEHSSFCDGIAF